MYERTIDNNNFTFAEHIRASDTFESKIRYMNMVKEEAYFELMLALTQMSIGKNRVPDELFKELKGYPMVLWMEVIGVVAHLDVVTEGNGWDTDPYKATIKDNKIYGRGTSDDKGGAIASLTAKNNRRNEYSSK